MAICQSLALFLESSILIYMLQWLHMFIELYTFKKYISNMKYLFNFQINLFHNHVPIQLSNLAIAQVTTTQINKKEQENDNISMVTTTQMCFTTEQNFHRKRASNEIDQLQ